MNKIEIKKYLSIELMMGSIVVLWYIISYYFKLGILEYYNIPPNYIDVNLSMLFTPDLGYFLVLGVCIIGFLGVHLLCLPKDEMMELLKKFWIGKVLVFLGSVFVYVLIPPYLLLFFIAEELKVDFWKYYLAFCIVVIGAIVYFMLTPYLGYLFYYTVRYRNRTFKYKSRRALVKCRGFKKEFMPSGDLSPIKYTALLVFYTILLCFSAYLYGYSYISAPKEAYFVVEYPKQYQNRIVVDSYKNYYITLPVQKNGEETTVKPEIQLINQENVKIQLRKTGQIQVDK